MATASVDTPVRGIGLSDPSVVSGSVQGLNALRSEISFRVSIHAVWPGAPSATSLRRVRRAGGDGGDGTRDEEEPQALSPRVEEEAGEVGSFLMVCDMMLGQRWPS